MGLCQHPFVVSESLLQRQDMIWDTDVQNDIYSYWKDADPRYLPYGCTILDHCSRTILL